MKFTIPQTRKAWISLVGGLVVTGAMLWQQWGDVIPGLDPIKIAAVGAILNGIAVFFTPNQLTDKQIAQAQALPPIVPPTSGAKLPWVD